MQSGSSAKPLVLVLPLLMSLGDALLVRYMQRLLRADVNKLLCSLTAVCGLCTGSSRAWQTQHAKAVHKVLSCT
ncbi:hypothetical protein JKP88DRAFT_235473 [Tribonema minus]|uniref:Secreted protein n=1 Tax=Tribonema minus TaxID=303371 RepID=A0A836CHT9_9STRA|nr:hypothetical protein JKP88DRAFT_235473 [Tribonema minus]